MRRRRRWSFRVPSVSRRFAVSAWSTYLPGPRMSRISTLRKGRKGFPQKGQAVLRLESSAVQPAMISSSYTRQSHVLQREQLEISNCNAKVQQLEGSSVT